VAEDKDGSPLPRRVPGTKRGPGTGPLARPELSDSDLQRIRAALDSAQAQASAPPAERPAPLPRRFPDVGSESEPPARSARPVPAALLPTQRKKTPTEPPPAVPAPRPSQVTEETKRGRGCAIITGSAIAMLVLLSAGSAFLLTRHAGTDKARPEASAKVSVRDRAAYWVATQVGRAGLISCDKAMCQALEARQVPAADLLVLRSGVADPLRSAVVVVTAAVKKMVGSRLLAADAPTAIASFGSGAAQISIRLIFRRGATAYAAALRREIADRKLAGTSFVLLDSRVARSAAIRQELRSGQVDSRLLLTLGEVASQWPVSIVAFGDRAPGASFGIPFRSADLVLTASKPGPPAAGKVQQMAVFVHQLGGYFAGAHIRTVRLARGLDVVRIEFTAPGRFGLLSSSAQ
jgi:hypothetical protein